MLPAQFRHDGPVAGVEHAAGRHRRVHDEERPRSVADAPGEGVEVEAPAPRGVEDPGREPGGRTRQPHPLEHAGVRGGGEDHLVARVHGGEQGVEQALGAARGDHALPVRVVFPPGEPPDVPGGRRAEVGPAREGQVAVGGRRFERGAGGGHGRRGRAQVGVEVLEPEDAGVARRRPRHPVDVEPRNVRQPPGRGARAALRGAHRPAVRGAHPPILRCSASSAAMRSGASDSTPRSGSASSSRALPGIVRIVKSSIESPSPTSAQASGADTVAPTRGRTE